MMTFASPFGALVFSAADLLAALGRASLHGGLALLLVLALCRYVPATPPRVRVWLWRLAFAKLLVTLLWSGAIRLPVPQPVADSPAMVAVQPVLNPPAPMPIIEPAPLAPIVAETAPAVTPTGPAHPARPTVHFTREQLLTGVLGLWLAAALWGLLRLLFGWRETLLLRRKCRPVEDVAVMAMVEDLAHALGVRQVPAVLTGEVASPVLIGWCHPVIVLPADLLQQDDAQALRLMLAHELAHIRHADLRWNWLGVLAEVVFFFHPLVWLARREWRLAREVACDALAMQATATSCRTYGSMLVHIAARHPQYGTSPIASVGIAESFHTLHRRLAAMMHLGRISRKQVIGIHILVAVMVVFGFLPWSMAAWAEVVGGEKPRLLVQAPAGRVGSIAISPDGKRLAMIVNSGLYVWNVQTGAIETAITEKKFPAGMCFTPDSKTLILYSGYESASITIVNIVAGKVSKQLPLKGIASAGIGESGIVVAEYLEKKKPSALSNAVRHAVIENDVTVFHDVDGRTGKTRKSFRRVEGLVVALSGNGQFAVVRKLPKSKVPGDQQSLANMDKVMYTVLNIRTGNTIAHLANMQFSHPMYLSADGCYLAATNIARNRIFLYDLRKDKLLKTLYAKQGEWIRTLAFSPDGQRLYNTTEDNHIYVWNTARGLLLKEIDYPGETVNGRRTPPNVVLENMAISPDGHSLYASSTGNYGLRPIIIDRMSVRTMTWEKRLQPSLVREYVNELATSADGRFLTLLLPDDRIAVYDLYVPRMVRSWKAQDQTMTLAAISLDGANVITRVISWDEASHQRYHDRMKLTVWDVATGREKSALGEASAFTYNYNGTLAASASYDGVITIWEPTTWHPKQHITTPIRSIKALVFINNDTQILSATGVGDLYQGQSGRYRYCEVTGWDIATGANVCHTALDSVPYFSPDGKWMAYADLEKKEHEEKRLIPHQEEDIVILRTDDGTEAHRFKLSMPDCDAGYLMFSQDSNKLVCCTGGVFGVPFPNDKSIVWDLQSGKSSIGPRLPLSMDSTSAIAKHAYMMATMTNDNVVKLWDTHPIFYGKALKERSTLYTFTDDQWLITTPQGYYNYGPDSVAKGLAWRLGTSIYPARKFEREYRKPAEIVKALQ